MFRRLVQTNDSWGLTVVRLILAIIFFAHGSQKMLGWFHGPGFSTWVHNAGRVNHIPAPLAVLAIFAEFFGSFGLLFGFLTRIAAFGIAVNMVVAISLVHWPNGFFMNWSGKQAGEGFEFHLLVLAVTIALILKGAGALSVDGALSRRSTA